MKIRATHLTHLQRLEAESIHIMREVVAECDNPVMLYSIGKDSAVMLHLARKAFFPSSLPFPLLHVDTTWKFRAMYELRDRVAAESGIRLLVHVNQQGLDMGINPFTHGSQIHTDVMKTQGLKQALEKYGFDAAFGGARRDEEKSRAKERIFSFRTAAHRWDPKNQRPELWKLYNARKHKGESLRVFPLSNWTELDIWQYIYVENIPIVPLYFAAQRPVVERDGILIMVDDDRMPLRPNEVPMIEARAVPYARLLSLDRCGGVARRHIACDHPGDAARPHIGTPGAGHRSRCRRLDGEEEARGLLLTPLESRPREPIVDGTPWPTSPTSSAPTSINTCGSTNARKSCASSPAAASMTARAR